MGETVRFGVSLDSDLLEKFDALCERQGCPSRSEALRDIIRDALVQDSLHSETADAAGVLSLIYDHHVRDLSRKLTERQHDAHGLIVTTLHVHLDHHNCLEILVLKGKAGELRELADQLRSIRGVTHGTFSITTLPFPRTSIPSPRRLPAGGEAVRRESRWMWGCRRVDQLQVGMPR